MEGYFGEQFCFFIQIFFNDWLFNKIDGNYANIRGSAFQKSHPKTKGTINKP